MEAADLKTIDDLASSADPRVELINGEIVKRPMARSEHALVQSGVSDEVAPFKRQVGPGGWWIMPEISVRYNEHQCPTHDFAGWRKQRVPARPTGIMQVTPDWVCEITSPGHERKDAFHNFMLLQRAEVPFYWLISPEDQTLIVYQWVSGHYHSVYSVECLAQRDCGKAHIPPFEEVAMDLAYIFGDAA